MTALSNTGYLFFTFIITYSNVEINNLVQTIYFKVCNCIYFRSDVLNLRHIWVYKFMIITNKEELMPDTEITKPGFSQYAGNEPYIFISYSHTDSEKVNKDIEWLNEQGFRIWYDEQIKENETTWTEQIQQKLTEATLVLAFASKSFSESKWVKKEIDLAIEANMQHSNWLD